MGICRTCGARISRYAAAGALYCATHEREGGQGRELRGSDAARALLRWRWHSEAPPADAGARLQSRRRGAT
jgi:hypothetical protein